MYTIDPPKSNARGRQRGGPTCISWSRFPAGQGVHLPLERGCSWGALPANKSRVPGTRFPGDAASWDPPQPLGLPAFGVDGIRVSSTGQSPDSCLHSHVKCRFPPPGHRPAGQEWEGGGGDSLGMPRVAGLCCEHRPGRREGSPHFLVQSLQERGPRMPPVLIPP